MSEEEGWSTVVGKGGNRAKDGNRKGGAGGERTASYQGGGGSGRSGGGYQGGGGSGRSSGGYQGGGGYGSSDRGYQGGGGGRDGGGHKSGGVSRRSGGGFRGAQFEIRYVHAGKLLDPYINQSIPRPQLGWTPLPDTQEEVMLYKYQGKYAEWCQNKINVSVNHFSIQSRRGPKQFAFPTMYHYDIGYEVVRDKTKTLSTQGDGNQKGKNKNFQDGTAPLDLTAVDDLKTRLEERDTDEKEKKTKGERPPDKKLPQSLTKIILDHLLFKVRKQYNHFAMATDGSFNLYTSETFHEPGSKVQIPMQHYVSFQELRAAKRMEEDEDGGVNVYFEPSIDKRTHMIHTIYTSELAKYYQSSGTLLGFDFSYAPELKQTLEAAANTFVKSLPPPEFRFFSVGKTTMVKCGQNDAAKNLGGGLVAWRGVSANISMGWKPYLNVDLANCVFMLNANVLTVLDEVINRNKRDRDVRDRDRVTSASVRGWSRAEYEEAKSFLKSCKITYMVNGRKYGGPVTDIGRKSVSESVFMWEEKGKQVSVFQYYKERYNTTLKYSDGPVLIIRKRAMVPAELCTVKEGQSFNRKLDGNQTTEMLRFSKKEPGELKRDIENQIKSFNLDANPVLKGLEIKMDSQMLTTEARVLVAPTLRYGQNEDGKVALIAPGDGTWEIWNDSYGFYKAAREVKRWGVLVAGCWKIKSDNDCTLWEFLDLLKSYGVRKGVTISTDPIVELVDARGSPEENRRDFERLFRTTFQNCQIVICVLPSKTSVLYNAVKHAAEVDVGILTQCITQDSVFMSKMKETLVQNILLKMNAKLGGINHVALAPVWDPVKAKMFCRLIMDCPILVLGADVTHAPPGSKKFILVNKKEVEFTMPSYAAVTGSVDKTCMPFMTEVRAQRKAGAGCAEVITELQGIILTMLVSFFEKSGRKVFPQKLIYYRDGVGEGQFPEVLHIEMRAMRRACEDFGKKYGIPRYEPKITFITVQKRHKTRIFWNQTHGVVANAPAGTVIDREIVHPTEIDFYLLSHKGMLGTSRPSRYHVLWDDSSFSLDEIQSLTYTLCYMYVRCTKSVKMPAPTYYAHLAAERAKKLCEGFENKNGQEPSDAYLNDMLKRTHMQQKYPMHFV